MLNWNPSVITLPDGRQEMAQHPEIVSASRSTDIPAFYSDWFFNRLKVGYSVWTNPFNNKKIYISYDKTRFIVFWSKNPRPLLNHLDYLKERGIKCYIQYSLNDYEKEQLEKVPPIEQRIDTFRKLVDKLGNDGVIWRFDPLILTDEINEDLLLEKISRIGDKLKGYTKKLVFSFADIDSYRKVRANLRNNNVHYHEWQPEQMTAFAKRLVELKKSRGWNYVLATCGEKGRYEGIVPNHCIDDELIIKRAYDDKELMTFLKAKIEPMPTENLFGETKELPKDAIILGNGCYATRGDNRDKGQREFCGCMKSKDIGQYNTCIHLCEYCYANTSKEAARNNYKCHLANPEAETITGK